MQQGVFLWLTSARGLCSFVRLPYKWSQTWCLKRTEMCSVLVRRPGMHRQGIGRIALPGGCEGESDPCLSAFWGFLPPWLIAAQLQPLPQSSLSSSHGLLPRASVSLLFFCLLQGHGSLGSGPTPAQENLTQRKLVTAAKTLFPNKATFTGSER